MAIQNATPISFTIICDGTSSIFSVDLAKDPYLLQGTVPNWFSTQNKVTNPVGAFSSDSRFSVSLSGSVLTVSFVTAPSAGVNNIQPFIIF